MAKVYVPLSPARSEHVYAPESPARPLCYEPVSPRRKLNTFEKILNSIQYKPQAPPKEPSYRRIHDWRSYRRLSVLEYRRKYIESMKIHENIASTWAADFRKKNFNSYQWVFDQWLKRATKRENIDFISCAHFSMKKTKERVKKDLENLRRTQEVCLEVSVNEKKMEFRKETLTACIKAWRESCPTPPPKPKEPINVPSDPYHVKVNMKVGEGGHVGVKISAPLGIIYDKYFTKIRKPPTDEYIVALREFGYPEWVLDRMKKKAEKRENNEPEKSVMESLKEEEQRKKPKKKEVSKLQKFSTKK